MCRSSPQSLLVNSSVPSQSPPSPILPPISFLYAVSPLRLFLSCLPSLLSMVVLSLQAKSDLPFFSSYFSFIHNHRVPSTDNYTNEYILCELCIRENSVGWWRVLLKTRWKDIIYILSYTTHHLHGVLMLSVGVYNLDRVNKTKYWSHLLSGQGERE